jgi:hypothetical protein
MTALLLTCPGQTPGIDHQPAFFAANCSSSSLHEGAQTGWLLPSSLRDFSIARGRCLPHKKHDMVAAPKDEVAAKGEPGAFDL